MRCGFPIKVVVLCTLQEHVIPCIVDEMLNHEFMSKVMSSNIDENGQVVNLYPWRHKSSQRHKTYISFTSSGYNALFGCRHKKVYLDQDRLCAAFICDVKLAPELNSHLLGDIVYMCAC